DHAAFVKALPQKIFKKNHAFGNVRWHMPHLRQCADLPVGGRLDINQQAYISSEIYLFGELRSLDQRPQQF
ncbi:MAG: hypothetical protein VW828_01100, partial [Candidatus Puniceispirillum sp.]